LRANEELERIRIESVRLRTWIRDEEAFQDAQVKALISTGNPRDALLAHELDYRAALKFKIHSKTLNDLKSLDTLDGQVNPRKPGVRIGHVAGSAVASRPTTRPRLAPYSAVTTTDATSTTTPMPAHYPGTLSQATNPDEEELVEEFEDDEDAQQELDLLLNLADALSK
jgi:hypothetical protein